MDVMERIRKLMDTRGIQNPNQLSKASGVPQSTLSSNFNHRYSPSVATLELLCKYFGITMAQLFADPETDSLYPLTEKQRELIQKWNSLSEEQQAAILNLLDVMK